MTNAPMEDFSAELERIAALPLAERADELGAVFDKVKDMLDSPDSS